MPKGYPKEIVREGEFKDYTADSKKYVREFLNYLLECNGDREQIIYHSLDTFNNIIWVFSKQSGKSVDKVITELLKEMKENNMFINSANPEIQVRKGRGPNLNRKL